MKSKLSIIFLACCVALLSQLAVAEGIGGVSYHILEPKILTNLKTTPGAQQASYIQVSVGIMGADNNAIEAIEHHESYIRHLLIKHISKNSRSKLRSPVGQAQVRQQVTDKLQEFMERENEEVTIENVLFTEIIIE